MGTGVDALSITWMIQMQARWFMLRSNTTMRRLAHWSGSFIHSWQESCVRIARAERLRRIFAK